MAKLNIGCGNKLLNGYVNIDLYVNLPGVLKAPADNLPYPPGSVDEIYSSHLLEHISHLQTQKVLSEWHRVLKPGGILRLVVPDLEWCVTNWLNIPDQDRWGFPLHTIFGLQIHPGEYHLTGFTIPRLHQLLNNTGFTSVTAERRPDPEHQQFSLWATGIKGGPLSPARAGGKVIRHKGKTYRFK